MLDRRDEKSIYPFVSAPWPRPPTFLTRELRSSSQSPSDFIVDEPRG